MAAPAGERPYLVVRNDYLSLLRATLAGPVVAGVVLVSDTHRRIGQAQVAEVTGPVAAEIEVTGELAELMDTGETALVQHHLAALVCLGRPGSAPGYRPLPGWGPPRPPAPGAPDLGR